MSLSSAKQNIKVYLLNFRNATPKIRDAAPARREARIAIEFPVFAKLEAFAAPTFVSGVGVAVGPGVGVAVGPGVGVGVGDCAGVGVGVQVEQVYVLFLAK